MQSNRVDDKIFYFKAFILSFGIIFTVYSFMMFQFWWGNHDWSYLIHGLRIGDTFFEARYSQLMPMVLLLQGQILPPLLFILTFLLLSLLGLLLGKYLSLPQQKIYYVLFILLLALSPYTPILFYYVFIMFSLLFWGCVGVSLLFLTGRPYHLGKFLIGCLGFFILLGSYPPILALVLSVFVGKLLKNYLLSRQSFLQIMMDGAFLVAQLIFAVIGYRIAYIFLTSLGYLNTQMYNLSVRSLSDIFYQFLPEIFAPMSQVVYLYNSLGLVYVLFYSIVLVGALWRIFFMAKNKIIAVFLVLVLFLLARLPFVLSASAYYATFRVNWWGNAGILAVCLSLIFETKQKFLRNTILFLSALFLFNFIKTDYEIQKVQYLAFKTERLFQKRVEERLFTFTDFNLANDYSTLNFGYPNFHHRFCYLGCRGFDNELMSATVLPADFGTAIFWDEIKSPVVARYGIWNNRLWFVADPHLKNLQQPITAENLYNLRRWMYMKAKKYPSSEGIFIDNKMIVFYFDDIFFNKNREMALHHLGQIVGK
ncbi:hypothetical protein IJ556_03885 [bacterium]|nr:hypothetical protein [bacterium]MBR2274184.1 hypothetical protein [Alphaproteobacteria bacterium]